MGDSTATRDPGKTREALKAAARELFAEHGFEGARTREIGARAGLNKAMINYHFGGKQGLYSEMLLEDIREAGGRFSAAIDAPRSSREQLAAFLEALGRLAEDRPLFLKILARELIDAGRHLDPQVESEFLGFFDRVRVVLRTGIERGEFRLVDLHSTHISLVGGLIWFALTAPLRERLKREGRGPAPNPGWPAYIEHYRELTLRGLAPSAPEFREPGGQPRGGNR